MASLMDLIMQQSMGGMTPQGGIPTPSAPAMPVPPVPAMAPRAPLPMMIGQPMPMAVPPLPPAMQVAPLPMPRPAMAQQPAGAPMQLAGAAPAQSVRESFMQRLLSGPVYQSTGETLIAQPQGAMPMTGAPMAPAMTPMRPQDINWGNPENPADFVRADQALRGLGLLG